MNFDNTLYPAIFTRKSTRNFSEEVISENDLNDIKDFAKSLIPLYADSDIKILIKEWKLNMYRIYAFGNGTLVSNINIGFMLQQLDLFLQTKKIGSLWYATGTKPREVVEEYKPLQYAICICFGHAKKQVSRAREEFKRKSLPQFFEVKKDSIIEVKEDSIIKEENLEVIFDAARLAPSAGNSQPIFYVVEENKIHVYCTNGGLINIYKRYNQFDIGISVCHTLIALQNIGYSAEPNQQNSSAPAVSNHYHALTLTINK